MIKAIVFDFDNTLGNRYKYAYEAFRQFLKERTDMDMNSLRAESLVQDFCVWEEGGASDKKDVIRRINDKYGTEFTYPDFRNWWNENLNFYAECYPGTIEMLKRLKDKYKIGCITNGSVYSQTGKLKNTGTYDLFDYIAISEAEGVSKPDRRIYEIMAEKLGLKPQECMFVGDAFSTDIVGALNAGFEAVWICPNQYQPCDSKIRKITQITDIEDML